MSTLPPERDSRPEHRAPETSTPAPDRLGRASETGRADARPGRLSAELALDLSGPVTVSAPTDPAEQEACVVAEQIISDSPPTAAAEQPREKRRTGLSRTIGSGTATPAGGDPTPHEPGAPLSPATLAWAQPAFGADFGQVRVHTGPTADRAATGVAAQAFTVGDHITFGHGRYAPDTSSGRRILAHELAHVLQPQASTVVHRVGVEDPPFGYFKAERDMQARAEEEKRAAAARTEAWRRTVTTQAPDDLKTQSADLRTDIERSGLAVIAARSNLLTKLGSKLPAGLAEDWAAARTSIELISPSLQPGPDGTVPAEVPTDVQEFAREQLAPFYVLLRSWELSRYNDAVATARNNYNVWRMYQMPVAGTRYADRTPPPDTVAPAPPGPEVRLRAAALDRATRPDAWRAVLVDFERSTALMDSWAVAMVPKDSADRQALEQAVGLHERQQELLRTRPYARKIPAIFYPKDEMAKPVADAPGQPAPATPQATGYPWFFYLYKKPGDPDWFLEDLTAPDKRVNVHDQTAGEGFAAFAASQLRWPVSPDPPVELWEQLNSKLRFPEGQLHLVLPSGTPYTLQTTAPTSLSEYLGYAALAIGAVTLVLFTAGAGTPAAVALVAGAAVGIAGTVAGLSELEEQGMATTGDRAKAGLMIAVDLASLLTLGLGRVAAGVAKAGETASLAARVAGRFFVPVARLSVGLDLIQLYVMTDQFVDQYRAISNQPGLTDEQRHSAQAKIVMVGLASGALSLWSVRSTLKDAAAHGKISADDLLPPGVPGAGRATGAAPTAVAGGPPRTTDLRIGRANLVEGAQLVETLAPGTVQVELRRNRWGLISEIAVVHGPAPTQGAKAFAADIAHHQRVALVAQGYSGLLGEIRELLEQLAAKFSGVARGPLERELELAKLEGRIQDRLKRLEDPKGIPAAERDAYLRDVESFRNQIDGHRQAIVRGDASTGRIAQQGTPDGHPVAPAGYKYHFDTVKQRWDVLPDAASGPRLHVEVNAQTGLPTGRFSNLGQLDSLHVNGLSVSDPLARQRLAQVGYEIDAAGAIRPAATVPGPVAAAMVPLRVSGGKVEVTPHVRLDAATLGSSSYYAAYRGKTLDTESMVSLHGDSRQVWRSEFVPVTPALSRAGAETLWRRGSEYGLIDYVRYHLFGPGTGLERYRIFLAPEVANQFANNQIEGFMRGLRKAGASVEFRVNYQTFAGPELRSFVDAMLASGDQKLIRLLARSQGRFERLLKSASYDIRVVDKQGVQTLYQASVVMGPPGPSMKGTVTATAPTVVPAF